MSTWSLPDPNRLGFPQLFARKLGWIGVDIGTSSIKLAQVRKIAEGWRLAARWALPIVDDLERESAVAWETSAEGTLSSISRVRGLFRGRKAAAALTMSQVCLRSYEIPVAPRQEMRAMVREELAAELNLPNNEFECDYWETAAGASPEEGVAKVTALGVPNRISQRFSLGLRSGGLECRVLDGLPCALARAVKMAYPESAHEPVGALDLGADSPLFVVAVDGRATFTRVLRNCGFQTLVGPLRAGLQISAEEARHLLARTGLPTRATASAGSSTENAVMELIQPPLAQLVDEISRTLAYVEQQYAALVPCRICLFGGGAAIRNLATHLTSRLEIPTAPWSLSESGNDGEEPLFGVAAALSALAWEESSCT